MKWLVDAGEAMYRVAPDLLVSHSEEVGVEVVEVCRLLAARVTAPWVGLRVEALVEEIERLVWVDNVAVVACVAARSGGRGRHTGGRGEGW